MASTNRLLSFLFLGAIATAIGACANPAVQECGATGIFCPAGTHCAAAEGICISDKNTCGDAHIDPGEVCDDGNTKDGDGCSSDCKSNETCGNSIIDTKAGEVCDDGNTADGDGCSATCRSNETCGNGITDPAKGEKCDDGNQVDGDGCRGDCKSDERCGNGLVDKARGEVCDDGNTDNGDSCSSDCKAGAGCGNGVIDLDSQGNPIEECDDGNQDNNDDCRIDCVINRCGDGVLDMSGTHVEQCDPTLPARTGGDRTINPTETAECNIDCTFSKCGDGKVNHHFIPTDILGVPAPGPEQCDVVDESGVSLNNDNADCTATCQINVCGDNKVDSTGVHHEDCDDGDRIDNNGCTNECKPSGCGDGILGPGEDCDDGTDSMGQNRNRAGARCNQDCKFNVCGDGDKLIGVEQCDEGSLVGGVATPKDTAACDTDCTFPVCGDDHTNMVALEGCDDGALNGTAASPNHCNSFCHINNCGNGILEVGEQCDDGTANNGPGKRCNMACKLNVCGDGDPLMGVEQCDDGSLIAGVATPKDSATCDSDCTASVCGDGHPNMLALEGCDEGPNNGQTGHSCNSFCQLNGCGNGFIDINEECDDGAGNNGPGKRCNVSCKFNVCGDGDKLTGVEQCDDGSIVAGVATPKDSATCDSDCTASVCGDGHQNMLALEGCDEGPDNGQTGHTCNSFCQINGCGNGFIDINEECDDGAGNNGPGKRCNVSCKFNVCGDGDKLNGVEQCDDGSIIAGVATPKDSATCDSDCTASVCGDGHQNMLALEGCDEGTDNGQAGHTCNSFCQLNGCGNGFIDINEECDDGPGNNGAGKRCNVSCKFNVCGDGDKLNGVEQCDDGSIVAGVATPKDSATCDSDCTASVCGDGHQNMLALEGCDEGTDNGQAGHTCNSFCQINGCGNGFIDINEECDDGAGNNGPGKRCNVSCKFNVCGDGDKLIGVEQCDDGSLVAGVATPKDSATCDMDCTFSLCGDGHKNMMATEACDDGNTNACGSCNADCSVANLSAAATGEIFVIDPANTTTGTALSSNLAAGDTFTLNDGFGHTATFEFDIDGNPPSAGHTKIRYNPGDTTDDIGNSILGAITAANGAGLGITASFNDGDLFVVLTNTNPGISGNTTISFVKGAASNLDKFLTPGVVPPAMTGGMGGNCAANVGCITNADCTSNVCNLATQRCM